MTNMIIDPPVGPFSPVHRIEQWKAELEELRRVELNPTSQAAMDRAIAEAQEWIDFQAEGAPEA